jgi:hypothetical protein
MQSSSVSCCLSYKVEVDVLFFVHPPLHGPFEGFLQLGHPKNGGGERHQEQNVHTGQGFRLENHLKGWEIDDSQLADQRETDGEQEHFVAEEADLECTTF